MSKTTKVDIILITGKAESGKSTVSNAIIQQSIERGLTVLDYKDTTFNRKDMQWSLASPLKRHVANLVRPAVLKKILSKGEFAGHTMVESALNDLLYGKLKQLPLKDFGNKSCRDLMQYYGNDYTRNVYGDNYYVKYMLMELLYECQYRWRFIDKKDRPKQISVVIDDLRQPTDLEWLRTVDLKKDFGITKFKLNVVALGVSTPTPKATKSKEKLTKANLAHSSETDVDITYEACDLHLTNKILEDVTDSILRLQNKVDKLLTIMCPSIKPAPQRTRETVTKKADEAFVED